MVRRGSWVSGASGSSTTCGGRAARRDRGGGRGRGVPGDERIPGGAPRSARASARAADGQCERAAAALPSRRGHPPLALVSVAVFLRRALPADVAALVELERASSLHPWNEAQLAAE